MLVFFEVDHKRLVYANALRAGGGVLPAAAAATYGKADRHAKNIAKQRQQSAETGCRAACEGCAGG